MAVFPVPVVIAYAEIAGEVNSERRLFLKYKLVANRPL
jgi:hypothetical protein